MEKMPLHEDRKAALLQWNAVHTIINSLEQRLLFANRALSEAQATLKLVDKSEVDALYERNALLTNMLEDQRLTIEALLLKGSEKGFTAVLTYIAHLENELINKY